jgi:hypothetical protein
MKISDFTSELTETMRLPVEVYEGAGGQLLLVQECPHIDGDRYLRILVPMREAVELAHAIIGIARRANVAG